MAKLIGKETILFEKEPKIIGYGSVAGKKEGEGPFGKYFDYVSQDSLLGEKTFEKAESELQKIAISNALNRAKLTSCEINTICAGDLLNQCIGSSFGIRELSIPFIGVYGACSTLALSIIVNCMSIESGFAKYCVSAASSHFCAAERQYRFPLEYGSQRTPTAQWTVTGSGAMVLSSEGKGPFIEKACIGKICDLGVKDQNNMGAAMAPAACSTIVQFLKDTNTSPSDYDMIYTGDLGTVGSGLLYELCSKQGVDIVNHHNDFGYMIFDIEKQDVHAGGSGCGCSASMMCSYIMDEMEKGNQKNILYCATGALLSPTSVLQGESIPGICHLVNIKINN